MRMKWFEGRGRTGELWEVDGRDGQFLGVLDCFRLFLEVKSLVERHAYIKTFGVYCSSGLSKGRSIVQVL